MEHTARKNSVLLVEDDLDSREVFSTILTGAGFDVITAGHGVEALERMFEIQVKSRCIILLDLMMPVMNGFQFLEWLRSNPAWEQVPVVAMTASQHAPPPDVITLLRKPFEFDELVKALRSLVG